MPWYNTITNWTRNLTKLVFCNHNSNSMVDNEFNRYERHTNDVELGSEEQSNTYSAHHTSKKRRKQLKQTTLHSYSVNETLAGQQLNTNLDQMRDKNGAGNHSQCPENPGFIPEEIISSVNNMALTSPGMPQDQIPGPSRGNNLDIDYRITSPTVDDIQSYRPPRNWLPSRSEINPERRVYRNKKLSQEKSNRGVDFNIPETGCSISNVNIIECRPPQNWVNAVENRPQQEQVYEGEFLSHKLKTHDYASNCSECDKQQALNRKLEIKENRSTREHKEERVSANINYVNKIEDSKHHVQKPNELNTHQSSEKVEKTARPSEISTQECDSLAKNKKRARSDDDDTQELQEGATSSIDIQSELGVSSDVSEPLLYTNSQHTSSSLKRSSDSQQIRKDKRRKITPPAEIITEEILNDFESILQATDLSPYEKNYMGRIYDVLKKCKEFETKIDAIETELDENKLYYFEENLQRNVDKLDRIDPQDSIILGEQRKCVIKYVYKILGKLEKKTVVE